VKFPGPTRHSGRIDLSPKPPEMSAVLPIASGVLHGSETSLSARLGRPADVRCTTALPPKADTSPAILLCRKLPITGLMHRNKRIVPLPTIASYNRPDRNPAC
jgi:hypothetical protein